MYDTNQIKYLSCCTHLFLPCLSNILQDFSNLICHFQLRFPRGILTSQSHPSDYETLDTEPFTPFRRKGKEQEERSIHQLHLRPHCASTVMLVALDSMLYILIEEIKFEGISPVSLCYCPHTYSIRINVRPLRGFITAFS